MTMASQYQRLNDASYSSLPVRLEIAVFPSRVMLPPEKTSRYTYKPLPPLPPLLGKASSQPLGHSGSSSSLDITTTRRTSTFPLAKRGHEQRESINKRENLLGNKIDRVTRQPTLEEIARENDHAEPPQLPYIAGFSTLDRHNPVDGFSDLRRFMRSDSEYSLSSASAYSQDNAVEEIVDIYSKQGSWVLDSETPTSPEKHSLYLRPSMYSESATEVGHTNPISNARRPSHASLDSAQISPKATTLAELITEERERFGGNSRLSRIDRTSSFQDQNPSEANTFEYPPWNEEVVQKRNYTPQPLAIRSKGFHGLHRSMSQLSDHSSDGGTMSNARDCVVSHIGSMPSPFKVPSRPSVIFKEKAATSTIQVPPTEHNTRKRSLSGSKHPLKSPFPFISPPHKKAHSDESLNPKQSKFVRRISNSFKNFSRSRHSPIIDSRIISNHARTGDGPDTPMPTKTGLMGIISPTAVLFQRGTLQIQDAMRKAKRITRVMSRDERRRDKLRKKIVVVGMADPSPAVSRWL
jgi:hypothetical protein